MFGFCLKQTNHVMHKPELLVVSASQGIHCRKNGNLPKSKWQWSIKKSPQESSSGTLESKESPKRGIFGMLRKIYIPMDITSCVKKENYLKSANKKYNDFKELFSYLWDKEEGNLPGKCGYNSTESHNKHAESPIKISIPDCMSKEYNQYKNKGILQIPFKLPEPAYSPEFMGSKESPSPWCPHTKLRKCPQTPKNELCMKNYEYNIPFSNLKWKEQINENIGPKNKNLNLPCLQKKADSKKKETIPCPKQMFTRFKSVTCFKGYIKPKAVNESVAFKNIGNKLSRDVENNKIVARDFHTYSVSRFPWDPFSEPYVHPDSTSYLQPSKNNISVKNLTNRLGFDINGIPEQEGIVLLKNVKEQDSKDSKDLKKDAVEQKVKPDKKQNELQIEGEVKKPKKLSKEKKPKKSVIQRLMERQHEAYKAEHEKSAAHKKKHRLLKEIEDDPHQIRDYHTAARLHCYKKGEPVHKNTKKLGNIDIVEKENENIENKTNNLFRSKALEVHGKSKPFLSQTCQLWELDRYQNTTNGVAKAYPVQCRARIFGKSLEQRETVELEKYCSFNGYKHKVLKRSKDKSERHFHTSANILATKCNPPEKKSAALEEDEYCITPKIERKKGKSRDMKVVESLDIVPPVEACPHPKGHKKKDCVKIEKKKERCIPQKSSYKSFICRLAYIFGIGCGRRRHSTTRKS